MTFDPSSTPSVKSRGLSVAVLPDSKSSLTLGDPLVRRGGLRFIYCVKSLHGSLEAAGSQTQSFSLDFDLLVTMKAIVLFGAGRRRGRLPVPSQGRFHT